MAGRPAAALGLAELRLPEEEQATSMPGRRTPHAAHRQWIGVPPHIAKWVGDPTRAWEMLSPKQKHEALPIAGFTAPGPQQAGTIRFVCVSDTHCAASMPVIPYGDVLLHAGDWTQTGGLREVAAFRDWLKSQKHARKICIAGNHDLTMDGSSICDTARRFGLVGSGSAEAELEQLCATARQMVESACALRNECLRVVGFLM